MSSHLRTGITVGGTNFLQVIPAKNFAENQCLALGNPVRQCCFKVQGSNTSSSEVLEVTKSTTASYGPVCTKKFPHLIKAQRGQLFSCQCLMWPKTRFSSCSLAFTSEQPQKLAPHRALESDRQEKWVYRNPLSWIQ